MNVTETLKEYGLTPKKYEELLKDCSDKVNKITDIDWAEINEKYNLGMNPDTLRKGSQPPLIGSVFVNEYFKEKYAKENCIDEDSYMKELQIMKDEIYKEKRKLYDQRREYNKNLTLEARSEHLFDELILVANKLNEEKPLFEDVEKFIKVNTKREALLCFSDWHYGMTTDNVWNTYNVEICKERIKKTIMYTIEFLKRNEIEFLHVINLGDSCHGAIHSGCRIESEEDTCDQIMHVAEIIAESLNELSKNVNHVTYYSCYGNHMRTIQDKKDSIESDNMEKLIPWWLEQRLSNNSKINIEYSEYKEFTLIPILGYNVCCVHGNLDNFKDIGVTMNSLFTKKFGKTIDMTISGDKHHLEEFERFGIESVLIRSLCGADEYPNNKRLYSKAGQTLIVFNNEYGRESTYHIPLD